MASKYIQQFPIPESFPEILQDLSKEILRNQPTDLLDFSAEYFKCLQEGTILDYAKKGQNIPCDFKTGIPVISERLQRKKPLNERDEALQAAAVEKSASIAKKPMTPDPKLLEADSSNASKQSKKNSKEDINLLRDLKGVSLDYVDNNYDAKKDVIRINENIGGDGQNNKSVHKDNEDQEEKEKENETYKIEGVTSPKDSIKSESKFPFDIIC